MECDCGSTYLAFSLNEVRFAVDVKNVREILKYSPMTRLPGKEAYSQGIINLRGTCIPVVDLGLVLGMAVPPVGESAAIIVLEVGKDDEAFMAGAVVDAVHGVVDLPTPLIDPPRFGPVRASEYLVGIGRGHDGFILVLDIDRIFDADRGGSSEDLVEAV
jgi:purine-binding chemotaxis protein CheW